MDSDDSKDKACDDQTVNRRISEEEYKLFLQFKAQMEQQKRIEECNCHHPAKQTDNKQEYINTSANANEYLCSSYDAASPWSPVEVSDMDNDVEGSESTVQQ